MNAGLQLRGGSRRPRIAPVGVRAGAGLGACVAASLAFLALGRGAPPDLIAPSMADLDRSLERITRLLDDAMTADAEWSRLQRAWVDSGCVKWACSVETGARLAAQLEANARRARGVTQSARAEWSRLERIQAFDGVRPLVGAARLRRTAALRARVLGLSSRYSARLAWNARFVDRWARAHARAVEVQRCRPPP